MISFVTTSSVALVERRDFWREAVCDQFVPLEVVPRGIPTGHVAAQSLGDLQLRRIQATAHRFVRSPSLIRGTDEDYFKLVLGLGGSTVLAQDGREAVLGVGDIAMYDSTRPYSFTMEESFDVTVCMLPKRLLPVRASELAALTATRIDGRNGVPAVVAPFLSEVFQRSDEMSRDEQDAVVGTVSTLMVALVRGLPVSHAAEHAQLARAKRCIAVHVAEDALGPDLIAAETGMSVPDLHGLFRRAGTTVAGHIEETRLEGVWRDLRSPQLAHVSIARVAASWGTSDSARMRRLFEERFGATPQEHRRSGS